MLCYISFFGINLAGKLAAFFHTINRFNVCTCLFSRLPPGALNHVGDINESLGEKNNYTEK
jgi:hypothetical protein